MHASVKGLLCQFQVSSLVVCVLSLLSLIGAYDLKLCKLIRDYLLIQQLWFHNQELPFNLLTGMHKFSVTNPQEKYQTTFSIRFRCYYLTQIQIPADPNFQANNWKPNTGDYRNHVGVAYGGGKFNEHAYTHTNEKKWKLG